MASCSNSSPEISAAPTTITADNSSNYSSLDDVLEDLSRYISIDPPHMFSLADPSLQPIHPQSPRVRTRFRGAYLFPGRTGVRGHTPKSGSISHPHLYRHWFYEDFVREGNPQFPSLPLKRFSQIFFRACPVLHQWSSDFEIAFNNFMQYKTRVPVCGAIMLNDTWEKVRHPDSVILALIR